MHAHVLDDAEHRDANLLKHLEAFTRVRESDVLGRGYDHGAAHRHALRESELDIAGARWHVDDQIVQIAPFRLHQQLIERRGHHGSAPRHRLLLIDEETDRHRLEPMRFQRLESLPVLGFRPPPYQAQHPRLARAVDVRVQDAHARALLSKRKRDVHGNRRLAYTAFAGGYCDQVSHARERLQAVLHRVRDDRARQRKLEGGAGGDWRAESLQRLDERGAAASDREAALDCNARAVGPLLDRHRRTARAERAASLRHDEGTQVLRQIHG